ncbi:MAG: 23S rRNA methyltransferase [Oscillospiraceae bacterium]|nr:23S rRNA methyltransferase [Oscillospiraceae bacterium]
METDAGTIYSNDDIKEYVEDKYGFKVHSAFIGQVREKLGIHQHENYRESRSDNPRIMAFSEEKEAAIIDALKHFGFM